MRKNGIILNINRENGVVMLVATILEVKRPDNRRVTIRVQHEVDGEWKRTDVTFWNNPDAKEPWKQNTADRIMNLKPRKGSVVMIRCKFQNRTMQNATGYAMIYNGIVRIAPDTDHPKDNRTVVFGTISSLKEVNVCGSDAVRASVYVGKHQENGETIFHYVSVTLMDDLAIMARTDLMPKDNPDRTWTRKKAAFCCGKRDVYYHPTTCPLCGGPMEYDPQKNKMYCADCEVEEDPDPSKKQESVFASDYIVTGEITTDKAQS